MPSSRLVMRAVLASALPLLAVAQHAPEFMINLDLPADQRHREVARRFKHDYPNFMASWEVSLARKLSAEERAEWVANSNIKQEFQDEMRGFVEEIGHPEVTFERLLLFNLMYELNYPTFCSGILAADSTGRVMHGRNLDFYMNFKSSAQTRSVMELAVNLTYARAGQRVFNAHSVAGYVGLHTAVKLSGKHKWSFQQNSHYSNKRLENLEAMKSGAVPFSFYVRELIDEELDFRTLVGRVISTRFSAPNFFLMAGEGVWEGASIEIGRNSSDPTANMDHVQVIAPQIGRVFLVQANDRIWDDPQDDRRPAANEMLKLVGGLLQVNEEGLMRMLRSRPLFNDYTTLSMVAVPATGYVKAITGKESYPVVNLLSRRRFKLFLR